MRTRTRILALLMALLTVFGTMWIPALAADVAEATLTITPEGETTTTYSGTYQEMHQMLVSLAPTVKTEYKLTLNKDAAYTAAKGFSQNENVYLTIDLNGYTLDVSKVNSNIYTISGSPHITIDGADDEGNLGTIVNRGSAGGLFYTQNKDANENFVGVVQNLNLYYTNMAQGYNVVDNPNKQEYPNQPMMHLNKGDVTMRNLHMTYTGEDAFAVEGSEGSPEGDITKLQTSMITAYGTTKLLIEDCTYVDTNTKGIKTIGITSSCASLTVKNSYFEAYRGVNISTPLCEITNTTVVGTEYVVAGGKPIRLYNCTLKANGGCSIANNANTMLGEGTEIITPALKGTYTVQTGFSLEAQANGNYKVVPNAATEAILTEKKDGALATYYSGTYQEMHAKLATLLKVASTVDGYYELKLLKDSSYTKHYDLVHAYTDGATATVVIDYNGNDLLVNGNKNNIYTIYGTTTGYYNFYIDGADDEGNTGTLTCVDVCGGLVFTRANNSLNVNTTVEVTNLNCVYTNMTQGISTSSPYPNQPMMHLPAGESVLLKNLHVTYTGEDATAMEGKNLSDLYISFIDANGVLNLYIEDCSFIDTNTKGVKTKGLNATGANTKVFIKNTEFSAYTGIIASAKHVEVNDSKVYGSNATYSSNKILNITDTVSVIGATGTLAANANTTFLYGEGKNTVVSAGDIKGTYTVQSGFAFVNDGSGNYTMESDGTVEVSMAIKSVGVKPTFTTGTFNTIFASLNGVKPSVKTEYILTLTKDAPYSAYKGISMNENAYVTIDLDGHRLDTSVHANIFQISGNLHWTVDGADKNGNRGLIYSTGRSGAIVYLQNNGNNNNTEVTIRNIELYYTNMTQGYSDTGKYPNQPMGNIPSGSKIVYDNVKMTYSGEDAVATEGSYTGKPLTEMYTTFISISGNTELLVKDCEFIDTNEKGITVRGIVFGGNTKATIVNTRINCDLVLDAGANNVVTADGCEFVSDKKIFAGKGQITVSNTTVRAENIFSGNSNVVLCEGTRIYTNFTDTLTGYYSVADDAILINRGNGLFTVANRADETIVDSGKLGESVQWSLTGSGILKLTGSGMISADPKAAPWAEYVDIITSIELENGIAAIGVGAFSNLTGVNAVYLPDTLRLIGNEAFSGCSALTDIAIPASVCAIGKRAFAYTSLTSAIFNTPEGWTADGSKINCTDPATAAEALEGSVSTWFRDTEAENVIASGDCGKHVTWSLGDNGVLTVSGSGNMTVFSVAGSAPWTEYKNLIFSVVVEEGVTSIGRTAFLGFENLVKVTLPDSLNKIGAYAFYGCISLNSVTIPENVSEIGAYAFRRAGVTEIVLSDVYGWSANGVAIGSYELSAESAAEYLTSTRASYEWLKSDASEDTEPNVKMGGVAGKLAWNVTYDGTLTVFGEGAMPNYSVGKAPWATYASEINAIVISEGVTSVGKCAFYGFTSVTSVALPDTLEVIGGYAFYGCSALVNITIPYAVTSIEPFAFRRTDLRNAAFECAYGWSVNGEEIPGYEMIGSTAASYVSKLNYGSAWIRDTEASDAPSDIIAGGSVGTLKWTLSTDGVITFSGSGRMPSFSAGETPWEAYKSAVTKVVIENGITNIGRCAFYGFTAIAEVTLPTTVTSIEEYAFYGCSALETVTIPVSTRTVGYYAFRRSGVNTVYFAKTAEWKIGNTWLEADYTANAAQMATNLKNGSYKDEMINVDGATTYVEIMLDGTPMEGYNPDIYSYTVNIDINTEDYKTVTVKADSDAQVITVTQATYANKGVATVTVTNGYGTVTKTYTITFNVTGSMNTDNAIVNKNGADAAVTYVIDDGQQSTGSFAKQMLDKYDYLTFTFAIWTKDFATLTEVEGEDGIKEYVKDENGNYVYTQTEEQKATVQFWTDILTGGRCEIASHSMTHSFWGTNDDGGYFEYVKNNATTVSSATMPKGSVTKELIASKQIIGDLFPSYLSAGFVIPGISVRTSNYTTEDGRIITTYNTYFTKLLKQAIADGVYTSARTTFQVSTPEASASKVITPAKLDTLNERAVVPAYMIVTENANTKGTIGDGIENWTAYIDHAIEQNGWACFCIHNIKNATDHNGHNIDDDDADALFGYTADKNVWVGTYTEVSHYYIEWSTATVTTAYENGKITVTLTDNEDDELFYEALTVKVAVPSVWDTATVNGETVEIHRNADGTSYVYVNIVPDTEAVSVIGG